MLRRLTVLLAGAGLLAGVMPAATALQTAGPGQGTWPVVQVREASLPSHTVFRPADLERLQFKLPIVVWENGSCRNDPWESLVFLRSLAAAGFLVVAKGYAGGGNAQPPGATAVQLMRAATDWAITQNSTEGSPYFGRLDEKRVVATGYSCGGFTSLAAAAEDKRIRSIFIINSGAVPGSNPSTVLDQITVPFATVNGGPTDIAFPYGHLTYELARTMPVWKAERVFLDSGHNEFWSQGVVPNGDPTSRDPNTHWQPLLAKIAVNWIDYTLLSGSPSSRTYLFGGQLGGIQCGFCADDPLWNVHYKGWNGFRPE